jgi:hypothetical protein
MRVVLPALWHEQKLQHVEHNTLLSERRIYLWQPNM